MFRISAFSRLGRVSVKALRLYDQKGLLQPAKVDRETGYRYYTLDQLPRLHRILALKEMGLSLDQISQLLNEDLPIAQIQGMLRLKQAELLQRLDAEKLRLSRVEARLRYLEQARTMPNYEIILKSIEPIQVISIRDTLANYPSIGGLFQELMDYLNQEKVEPSPYCAAIWHDPEYKEKDVDGEAVISVSSPLSGRDRIKLIELPAIELMACAIHRGSYSTLNLVYTALLGWIEENRYDVIGPNREVYLRGGVEQDNPDYVTEIQFPVSTLPRT